MKHNTTRAVAVTALTVAALTTMAGTATADTGSVPAATAPDAVTVQILPGVQFTESPSTGRATYRTPMGSVDVDNGKMRLEDAQGRTINTPLTASTPSTPETRPTIAADSPVAVAVAVADHPAALVATSPAPAAAPLPADPTGDAYRAWRAAGPYTTLAGTVGGMVGGVGGVAIGCPFGAVTGGTLMTLESLGSLTIAGAIGGCIVGAGVLGAAGSGALGLLTGVPIGVAVAIQKYNEMQAKRAQGIDPSVTAPLPDPAAG
ncbi:hypothetical protein [Nocardia miyunensis]|uniref:hypothetical protein n=1 Tax=Nocardia miyunensis TaxID=282684 RepID=UPI0008297216|nr:hypothetical protein [Nocardia miyunensis]